MRPFQRLLLAAALSAAASCRTSEPVATSQAEAGAGAAAPARQALGGTPKSRGPAPVGIPDDAAQPSLLKGFDQGGAAACLPLAAGDHCVPRADALATACTRVKGEAFRCEDCSLICSKELPLHR